MPLKPVVLPPHLNLRTYLLQFLLEEGKRDEGPEDFLGWETMLGTWAVMQNVFCVVVVSDGSVLLWGGNAQVSAYNL